jgi:hypothetical protein
MTPSENECREAFEMAFKESMPLTPGFGRQYLYDEAHFAWQGWQAAWNARSQDAEDARRFRFLCERIDADEGWTVLEDYPSGMQRDHIQANGLREAIDAAMSK